MPIFEYQCRRCGRSFESLQRAAAPPPACPGCGSGRPRRTLSVFSPAARGAARPCDSGTCPGGGCESRRCPLGP